MTYVRSDEDEADAVERVLARVENYPFEIDPRLPTADSTTSASSAALVISPQRSFTPKKGERMKDKLKTQQVVHDDLSHVQGQRAGTARFRSRSLSPTRTEIEASTARSFVATWRVALLIAPPKQVEHRYRKRSGIETTYRLLRQHADHDDA